jgi:hypothetical protein
MLCVMLSLRSNPQGRNSTAAVSNMLTLPQLKTV